MIEVSWEFGVMNMVYFRLRSMIQNNTESNSNLQTPSQLHTHLEIKF